MSGSREDVFENNPSVCTCNSTTYSGLATALVYSKTLDGQRCELANFVEAYVVWISRSGTYNYSSCDENFGYPSTEGNDWLCVSTDNVFGACGPMTKNYFWSQSRNCVWYGIGVRCTGYAMWREYRWSCERKMSHSEQHQAIIRSWSRIGKKNVAAVGLRYFYVWNIELYVDVRCVSHFNAYFVSRNSENIYSFELVRITYPVVSIDLCVMEKKATRAPEMVSWKIARSNERLEQNQHRNTGTGEMVVHSYNLMAVFTSTDFCENEFYAFDSSLTRRFRTITA